MFWLQRCAGVHLNTTAEHTCTASASVWKKSFSLTFAIELERPIPARDASRLNLSRSFIALLAAARLARNQVRTCMPRQTAWITIARLFNLSVCNSKWRVRVRMLLDCVAARVHHGTDAQTDRRKPGPQQQRCHAAVCTALNKTPATCSWPC
jgi:hypothetical protein